MPLEEWTILSDYYKEHANLIVDPSQGDDFRVEVTETSIDYIYGFDEGLDYEYYAWWSGAYLDNINAELEKDGSGIRYRVSAEGKLSDATNPWTSVNWLPGVNVVDGDYLETEYLGWLLAENWDVAGQFWAYPVSGPLAGSWLYVLYSGFYYSMDRNTWLWNWPGTPWMFQYDLTGETPGFWFFLESDPPPPPRMAGLDDIVIDEMIKQNIPGIAVGVFKDGALIHLAGYGVTDIESQTPVTTNTLFRWASISKPLTSIAAFQMMEDDSLDFNLNDKVIKHAPYWEHGAGLPQDEITIRHLLTNRSGIHQYGNGFDFDGDGSPDNTYSWHSSNYGDPDPSGFDGEKSVSVFMDTGLDFYPGDQYLYTSFGFNLLGAAIDTASPTGYVDWVMQNIANPLGMDSLQVSTADRAGYRKVCDGVLNKLTIKSVEWKLPGGGWESDIHDLAKFAMGIAEGSLLVNTTSIWQPVPGNGDYSHGINAVYFDFGTYLYHGGAHDNLRTRMTIWPLDDSGVVVMTYAEHADTERIAYRLENAAGFVNWSVNTDTVVLCDSDIGACNGQFTAVWRKTDEDVILRRGYSHAGFLHEWQFLRENGYYCDEFEVHMVDGQPKWDGIFRKGTGANAMWRGYDFAAFEQKVDEMAAIGQRLVDVEVYLSGQSIKYAGLFRPGTGSYAIVSNLSTAEFATRREELAAQGMKLIDIESVLISDDLQLWAGVFVAGQDGLLNRNYTAQDFFDLTLTRATQGWRLIDIETYNYQGGRRYAGIWEQATGQEVFFYDKDYCELMDIHDNYRGRGFEMVDWEYYE